MRNRVFKICEKMSVGKLAVDQRTILRWILNVRCDDVGSIHLDQHEVRGGGVL